MSNRFKLLGGSEINDVGRYVQEYVKKHKDVTIHIGTDSMKNKSFATVICFHFEGKGVHYIFKRFQLEPILDVRLKILKEATYTMELAEYLDPFLKNYKISRQFELDSKAIVLHSDVNPNECWDSNKAYKEITGWFTGSGYEVRTKPYAWAASTAADFLCK